MKIVQIENNFVHWDATNEVPDLDWAKSHYAPNIVFVEAPDYVFEGWGYIDGEFIQPEAPEGWIYNEENGTFYPEGEEPMENTPVESGISDKILNQLLDSFIE